nr:hypothetical protein KXZ65_16155 [Pectobacterium sp. PL152]
MSANQLNSAAVKAKVASAIKVVLSHQNSSKPANYYAIGQKVLPYVRKYWGQSLFLLFLFQSKHHCNIRQHLACKVSSAGLLLKSRVAKVIHV